MTKKEKQQLAKKIIRITDEEIDDEHFIHRLLEESTLYNIYEDERSTFGQKAADALAGFAGSWAFVIIFIVFLALWISGNIWLLRQPFDPYPFILLNLILSCVSALQAPLIMMSQNRQEAKDRKRSEGDYKINLKSEIIIEDMHYKLDAIIARQAEILKYLSERDNDKYVK
ncbi:MAG: DUF1003 domain-containing protein [Oscillospiraceae bacterium]|nr:DUF1003 domain-containing protein [Oscillospiraceae bacterium]